MFEFIQLVVISFIAFLMFQGICDWIRNNNLPTLTQRATVIGKRELTHYHHCDDFFSEDTEYFVIFQLEEGENRKFKVSKRAYRELEEGMKGALTYQGTRYKDFEPNL